MLVTPSKIIISFNDLGTSSLLLDAVRAPNIYPNIDVSNYNNFLFYDTPKYYYSETYKEGNYWHYDENKMPIKWN